MSVSNCSPYADGTRHSPVLIASPGGQYPFGQETGRRFTWGSTMGRASTTGRGSTMGGAPLRAAVSLTNEHIYHSAISLRKLSVLIWHALDLGMTNILISEVQSVQSCEANELYWTLISQVPSETKPQLAI